MQLLDEFRYFGLSELIYECMADSIDDLHSKATVAFNPQLYDKVLFKFLGVINKPHEISIV
jgi:hypothetical protein